VDLGATSIDVALSTLGSELVAHRGEPADVREGTKAVLGRMKDLLSDLLEEQGVSRRDVRAIGVGFRVPSSRRRAC
jgi:glucokinase